VGGLQPGRSAGYGNERLDDCHVAGQGRGSVDGVTSTIGCTDRRARSGWGISYNAQTKESKEHDRSVAWIASVRGIPPKIRRQAAQQSTAHTTTTTISTQPQHSAVGRKQHPHMCNSLQRMPQTHKRS
jgi:hypothetical protein